MYLQRSTFENESFNLSYPSVTFHSLNEVIHTIRKKCDACNIIFRSENLPAIPCDEDRASDLFETMVSLIAEESEKYLHTFLYINCEEITLPEVKKDNIFPKRYLIRLNTNVTVKEGWQEKNAQDIERCKKIVSFFDGTLAVNAPNSKGCLFSVTVPGKLQ